VVAVSSSSVAWPGLAWPALCAAPRYMYSLLAALHNSPKLRGSVIVQRPINIARLHSTSHPTQTVQSSFSSSSFSTTRHPLSGIVAVHSFGVLIKSNRVVHRSAVQLISFALPQVTHLAGLWCSDDWGCQTCRHRRSTDGRVVGGFLQKRCEFESITIWAFRRHLPTIFSPDWNATARRRD
jgi:hypothetical protein